MDIKKILFPTDFSIYTNAALRYASSLAAESGALLYIVHVDDLSDLAAGLGDAGYPYAAPLDSEERLEVRGLLEKISPPIAGVKHEHRYLKGSPVNEILKLAEHERVDLIVMGSHGRRGLARLLMGSVAEGVMRRAKCPVLIVKQPADAPERTVEPATSAEGK